MKFARRKDSCRSKYISSNSTVVRAWDSKSASLVFKPLICSMVDAVFRSSEVNKMITKYSWGLRDSLLWLCRLETENWNHKKGLKYFLFLLFANFLTSRERSYVKSVSPFCFIYCLLFLLVKQSIHVVAYTIFKLLSFRKESSNFIIRKQ